MSFKNHINQLKINKNNNSIKSNKFKILKYNK